jgi:hypothetical protein
VAIAEANVKVYGGLAEEGFLRALSDLIGDYSYTDPRARFTNAT